MSRKEYSNFTFVVPKIYFDLSKVQSYITDIYTNEFYINKIVRFIYKINMSTVEGCICFNPLHPYKHH